MHEMALVRKVVEIVLDECEGRDVSSVHAVHLTIGEMADVIEEYIPDLFRHLAKGTVAQDASIVIRRIPMTVRCECGNIFHIDSCDPKTWECPCCHAYQKYRLFSGNEFQVDFIEVEGAEETPPVKAAAA